MNARLRRVELCIELEKILLTVQQELFQGPNSAIFCHQIFVILLTLNPKLEFLNSTLESLNLVSESLESVIASML